MAVTREAALLAEVLSFEDAEKAYLKALDLDPKNVYIRQNYDLFKEIHERTKRRTDR